MKIGDTFTGQESCHGRNDRCRARQRRSAGVWHAVSRRDGRKRRLHLSPAGAARGKSTVGTKGRGLHVSPSPVGMEITVTVEVTDISANGKMVDFTARPTPPASSARARTSAPSSPWIASWTSAGPSSADFVRRNPDVFFRGAVYRPPARARSLIVQCTPGAATTNVRSARCTRTKAPPSTPLSRCSARRGTRLRAPV